MAKRHKSGEGDAGGRRRPGGARPPGDPTDGGDLGPSIPGWLPAVVFVGLAVVLFRAFIFSDQMLYGGDTLGLGYVARAFYHDALRSLGTFPLWSPLILGGTPFIEALSAGDSLYPPSLLLLLVMDTHRALGWKLVIHFIGAGFFMFGWLRAVGTSRAAAVLGGAAYMLAPYFVSLAYAGHDGKIFVTALAPLLFWAVERHFQSAGPRSIASIGLIVGGIILTTHFQMAYFLFLAVGAFALFRSIQIGKAAASSAADDEDARAGEADAPPAGVDDPAPADAVSRPEGRGPRRRSAFAAGAAPFSLFLAASGLGAGVAAVQFLPAVDYVTEYSRRIQTTREEAGEAGVGWSSSWSLHPEDVVGLIIPEFVGNNARTTGWTTDTYWGRNAFKNNHEAAGLVILLLAGLSFAGAARRGLRLFFAGVALVALLFGLGIHTPVWGFFYAVVPGIRLFRAPGQIMFLFSFAAATLGALGVDRLLQLDRDGDEKGWSTLMKTLAGIGGAVALVAVLASSGALLSFWTSVMYALPQFRAPALASLEPFIQRGAGIALLMTLATAGLVLALRAGRLAPAGLVVGLSLLVVTDEMRVSSAFVDVIDFYAWSQPDSYTDAILELERESDEPFRLLSLRERGQDVMPALHGIELAAGHHPNDLSRYRELIGMVGSDFPRNLGNPRIRQILNITYVLWPDAQMGGPFAPPQTAIAGSRLQDGSPYETLHADVGLARARLVGSAVVKSDEEAVEYMLDPGWDPRTEVVLAEEPPIELDGGVPEGGVQWLERSLNRHVLQIRTDRPAMLVVADNWFPAWQATVDGEPAPVLRAYHALRAVPVPAGEHTVQMVYRSGMLGRSLFISILLAVGLSGVAVGATVLERRGRRAS